MPSVTGRMRGRRPQSSLPRSLRSIGPEVLSGASDNDPTNVGTAVAVGAQTAYQLSWVALLVAPLLGVVLTIAAQVGAVARADLQTLTVKRHGQRVGAVLLASVVLVTWSRSRLISKPERPESGCWPASTRAGWWCRWDLRSSACWWSASTTRWLPCCAMCCWAFSFLELQRSCAPGLVAVLRASLVPTLSLSHDALAGGLALLGTTLTSYVYVWETVSRGSEEPHDDGPSKQELSRARIGAVVGAVFTAVILWFMLVASAATLGQHHETVTSAQDAAQALGPLAGSLASDLFAFGLLVSAVVALPVLMATTAYVVGAQFDWRRGLSERVAGAQRFYLTLAASIGLGLATSLAEISAIDMLGRSERDRGLGTVWPDAPCSPGPGSCGHGRPTHLATARRRRLDGRRGCWLLLDAAQPSAREHRWVERVRLSPGQPRQRTAGQSSGLRHRADLVDCHACPCGPTATRRRGRWRRVDDP